MDVISVNDNGLKSALTILDGLRESTRSITENCISSCNSALSGVDIELRSDLQAFMESVYHYQKLIDSFTEQNSRAIEERLSKMELYSQL